MLPPRDYTVTVTLFDGTVATFKCRGKPSDVELKVIADEANIKWALMQLASLGEEAVDCSSILAFLKSQFPPQSCIEPQEGGL